MQNSYQSDKLCAMTDIELTERFRNAVKIENKIKFRKKVYQIGLLCVSVVFYSRNHPPNAR